MDVDYILKIRNLSGPIDRPLFVDGKFFVI